MAGRTREIQTDILVAGGGLGGIAAALSALRLGRRVVMTEETDWIGGQLTAQAVPPDEHLWIEATGCTASYRMLRERIREYYRRNYPLLPQVRNQVHLNPGNGRVSSLCHEPRVALASLEELLAPFRSSMQLDILLRHRPVEAETEGDLVRSVTFESAESGDRIVITAPRILDATELGELIHLAGVEHVIGAESRDDTDEPNASLYGPAPHDQQSITWCFAMDFQPGEDHTIRKPDDYDRWRSYRADFWPGPQLGWHDVYPDTLLPRYRSVFHHEPSPTGRDDYNFWMYRRIFNREYYPEGTYASDITLVNWPQNDCWSGPLLGVPDEERDRHLRDARQLSLSLLYWMQTEAPRPDGRYGYPGLRLRRDVTGSEDGLAKSVYIREARRIIPEFRVLEQHVGVEARGTRIGAERFPDSVGIGSYRIDLHPSTSGRNYVDISTWPFQIPLGALLPIRVENLLPAAKNIGTTHITNGCYRLHPVEWTIGEAAGALAAFSLDRNIVPRQVRGSADLLEDFQRILTDRLGFELEWPEYARVTPRLGNETLGLPGQPFSGQPERSLPGKPKDPLPASGSRRRSAGRSDSAPAGGIVLRRYRSPSQFRNRLSPSRISSSPIPE